MSNYDHTKSYGTTIYPVHANGVSGLLKRVEPLLTPSLLKSRHLKGILELAKRFGITYTDDELKDYINVAMNQAELELGINIVSEQIKEKHPFDINLYKAFIHTRTEQGPIISLESLAIVSSSGQSLFTVPAEWIESAQFHQRQVNVIPLLSTFGAQTFNTPIASGGIAYLSILLNYLGWVPSYWEITYTTGVCRDSGQVPVVVNELVGVMTAISLLSQTGPHNINSSVSIGQDGVSQASSGAGVQVFQYRMQELEKKKDTLMKQIKRVFSAKYFLSSI